MIKSDSDMFERFTDNARKSMALANQEAQRLRHEYIGINHILLGITLNRRCTAWAMLENMGVNTDDLKTRLNGLASPPSPQAPMAKRTIECAICESRDNGDGYIGSEHLLLGLIRADSPDLRPTLSAFGIDLIRARECLHSLRASASKGKTPINATRSPEPVGAYPTARRVGNLLFLSGQGPRQRGSKDIPGVVLGPDGKMLSYDIAAQVRAVFQNVEYVLEENGSSMKRIVDVTCFLTNLEKDFAGYNKAYAELFPPGPNQPCRTTLGISSLPQGGNAPIAFEVKVIATL
jgi:2-aminomuconate deaminase